MTPTNSSGGGVAEITFIFQAASSASKRPARKPTRGSGLGGVTSKEYEPDLGSAPLNELVDIVEGVQPVTVTSARTSGLTIQANCFQYVLIGFRIVMYIL